MSTPAIALEIWDEAIYVAETRTHRKLRSLYVVLTGLPPDGRYKRLETRLPLTNETALRQAAAIARLMGQGEVVWHSPVRHKERLIDGVRIKRP